MKGLARLLPVFCLLVTMFAHAQDPARVGPDIYGCMFENDRVRVCEVRFKPGASIAMHSHPEHIIYVTQPGKLRIVGANGTAQEVEFKLGQVLASPAETHSASTVGNKEVRAILVELKEPRPMTAEQSLMQMEKDWGDAMMRGDIAALERIVADDWVLIGPAGERQTRAEAVADLRSGDLKFESMTPSDMQVRIFGDTAIVTGKTTDKATLKGQDVSGDYRFTDVFVKRDGQWRAVSTQVTRVMPPM